MKIMHWSVQLLLVFLLAAALSAPLMADEFRGRIVKMQGEVYIIDEHGQKREPGKSQNLVNTNETVVTRKDGKAVVQFDDGALSVIDEKSSLQVEEKGWLSQLSGKVFYVFRKVLGTQEERKVKTSYATMGIRGTTFIVYDNDQDGQGVALQEGLLNIESPGDPFAVVTEKPKAESFDDFKRQMQEKREAMQNEFKEYKKQTMEEFVEYKKSFELKPNRVVSFDGNRVRENDFSADTDREFEDFSGFAGDYVKAYRELEESTRDEMDDMKMDMEHH